MSSPALKIVHGPGQQTDCFRISKLDVSHRGQTILQSISLGIPRNQITCIIGPSGSGKSTLLRSLNRMEEGNPSWTMNGSLTYGKQNLLEDRLDLVALRKSVGMVFQKPCVFPVSIYENVLFGLKAHRKVGREEGHTLVKQLLQSVGLWAEVSDRLNQSANQLSIGQQQRLCMARTLALSPEVLLLDEPTSSLDPQSTKAIENYCQKQKGNITHIFVTHNLGQAKRIADYMVFICEGELIEQGASEAFFNQPKDPRTQAFLSDETCAC